MAAKSREWKPAIECTWSVLAKQSVHASKVYNKLHSRKWIAIHPKSVVWFWYTAKARNLVEAQPIFIAKLIPQLTTDLPNRVNN